MSRVSSGRFGWCSTGHHEMCIKVLSDGVTFCKCSCHGNVDVEPEKEPDLTVEE